MTLRTIVERPRGATALFVMAHGAGAGMRHPFMEAMAKALAREKMASLRYEFPYMAAGKKRPDPASVCEATVAEAIAIAKRRRLPILAGGKSMGGRMTSQLIAREGPGVVRGLVFLGFPFHKAGEPSEARSRHLHAIELPMLFLQGTRDALADIELVRRVIPPHATLYEVPEGDHSFAVPKRSGRTAALVIADLAAQIAAFSRTIPTVLA
ncbi:MAG: alpha/beta hydrolase family protein [Polyangiales bacterium]